MTLKPSHMIDHVCMVTTHIGMTFHHCDVASKHIHMVLYDLPTCYHNNMSHIPLVSRTFVVYYNILFTIPVYSPDVYTTNNRQCDHSEIVGMPCPKMVNFNTCIQLYCWIHDITMNAQAYMQVSFWTILMTRPTVHVNDKYNLNMVAILNACTYK